MRSKEFLTAGIGFLLFLFIFIPTVHAEKGQIYEVGTQSLNVRSAPSHSAKIIGNLDEGDHVVVFQESFGWVQTYYDGQEAWVASQYLFPASKRTQVNTASNQKEITITENEVQIRTGPGTSYKVIGSTSKGDTFNLLETKNDWHKVTLNDDSTGWIAAWLTSTYTGSNPSETSNKQQVAGVTSSSLEGYNIVIDPGHGGKDSGAIGIDGIFEKDLIMMTADNIAQQLRAAGATVILTRTDDYFVPLDERVQISNAYNTDAFISIHFNAFPLIPIQGISTHYYSYGASQDLARDIQASVTQGINMQNRGIMQSNYHVLRENSDAAVLIELGFITNPHDLSMIQTTDYQNNVAEGIVDGLKNYFQ
ncbi:N-acetylmuramoyl-L-alanine amidase [Virgibacillus ndiopensis]|uniref:N-acetylmuramoyl-L-alanine amidase n=1 Tax=Virgibacillus ndiopensis TaxID=2004408 RepID=UPI000C0817EF|nr:N-acetylmuramoyl-L-alanine amidase [Virgibacillus ndiopensis]